MSCHVELHSFLSANNMLFCGYTTFCLSSHLVVIWVITTWAVTNNSAVGIHVQFLCTAFHSPELTSGLSGPGSPWACPAAGRGPHGTCVTLISPQENPALAVAIKTCKNCTSDSVREKFLQEACKFLEILLELHLSLSVKSRLSLKKKNNVLTFMRQLLLLILPCKLISVFVEAVSADFPG